MSTSLYEFAKDEAEKLEKFVTWYEAMSKIEPEKYPIKIPNDNAGVWFDMLMDFDPSIELYQLPSDSVEEETSGFKTIFAGADMDAFENNKAENRE
jgi:hypothetical protein